VSALPKPGARAYGILHRWRSRRRPGRAIDWQRLLPVSLVALAVTFGLVVLRGETVPAQNVNDGGVHRQMIHWAGDQIDSGRVPLDGWYPYFGLGSPHFHRYQSLPHLVTGYLTRLVSAELAYTWTLYLLLALWPICIYASARLFGWGRWSAAGAALISPLLSSTPGHGYEFASYSWQGFGVWSQLWAMWMLPLAWALTWRAVARKKSYALAVAALSLAIALHFLTGYLAALSVGIWILLVPRDSFRRLGRAVVVGVGTALTAAWVLVPILQDSNWMNRSIYGRGDFYTESFGARKVLGWLVTGQLFDTGRFPIVTILVGIGFIVCLRRARSDERSRALVGVWILSLLLFFGRRTFGALFNVLPASEDLLFHRYIMGVHLAGIFLAGVALASVFKALYGRVKSKLSAVKPAIVLTVVIGLSVLSLTPAWVERSAHSRRGAEMILSQRLADMTDGADLAALIEQAKGRGDGRIYGGLRSNWGPTYRIGQVPVYSVLANQVADAIGFTLRTVSLSTDIEALFDEANPAHYNLMNIRYLLLPDDRSPPVPAEMIGRRGRHTLWQVATTGYLEVVDTTTPISATRSTVVAHLGPQLATLGQPGSGYPTVAFGGVPAANPTVLDVPSPLDAPGIVDQQASRAAKGEFDGRVVAKREAVVILKSSFDPRWKAFVDWVEQPSFMVAPTFVGVKVPSGVHQVAFRYSPYPGYPLLFLLGALTMLCLALGPRFLARRRTSPRVADGEAGSALLASEAPVVIDLSVSSAPPGKGEVLIVVPAFNEAESIATTLGEIARECPWADVVVINDGSWDATAAIAGRFGYPVLSLPFNLGIGGAVQTGFQYAMLHDYVVVVQVDGDGQHPAGEVARLAAGVLSGENDILIGSRFLTPGAYQQTFWRGLGGRILARFISVVTRRRITDPTSGLRAYSREAVSYLAREYPYDYPEPEVLVYLGRKGFRVSEIAVGMRARRAGASSLSALGPAKYMFKTMLAIGLSALRSERKAAYPRLRPKERLTLDE
jgi:hypothetical protein